MAWAGSNENLTEVANELVLDEGFPKGTHTTDDFDCNAKDGCGVCWREIDIRVVVAENPADTGEPSFLVKMRTHDGGGWNAYRTFNAGEYECDQITIEVTVVGDPAKGQRPKIISLDVHAPPVNSTPMPGNVLDFVPNLPGDPTFGDRYVLTTDNAIYTCIDSQTPEWRKTPAWEGMQVYGEATEKQMFFTGVGWVDTELAGAHDLGGSKHGPDSLANLNSKVTGGNLDFDTASRPPTAHTLASHSTKAHTELTGVASGQHHAQAHREAHISTGPDAFTTTDLLEAIVKRVKESGGTVLLFGAVADETLLKRSGVGIVGTDSPSLKKLIVNQTAAADIVDIKDGGVQVQKIYDGGIVDFPKQSGCSVYRNAAFNIPNNIWTVIPFDTETFDTQSEFDTGSHSFVVQKAGVYLIKAQATFNNTIANIMHKIIFTISGTTTQYKHCVPATNGTFAMDVSMIVYLTAGKSVICRVHQITGAARALLVNPYYTNMQIMKLA